MPDFAPNFTDRYRVTYRSNLRQHTVTFRANQDITPGGLLDIRDNLGSFFDILMPLLPTDFAILSTSFSPADTDFFLPVDGITLTETPNPLNLPTLGQSPNFLSFGGLSIQGNSTRVFIYGVMGVSVEEDNAVGNDYRITRSENGVIDLAINDLQQYDWWVAADNLPVQFVYQFANFGKNSYYQRKARRG